MFGYVPNISLKVHNIDFCTCMISCFRREAHENCPLLGYYVTCSDSLTDVSGPIRCPETSVWNYYYSLRNNPEQRSSRLLNLSQILLHLSHTPPQPLPWFTHRRIRVTFLWTILRGPDYWVGQPTYCPRRQSLWWRQWNIWQYASQLPIWI